MFWLELEVRLQFLTDKHLLNKDIIWPKKNNVRLQYIQNILRSKRKKGASYQDIKSYLEKKFEEKDLGELKFTERTFQRDKKAHSESYRY